MLNKRLDDLIEAGWHVIDTDFDGDALQHWRTQVTSCLSMLLGPDENVGRQTPESERVDN
jgi:hypothetical protein